MYVVVVTCAGLTLERVNKTRENPAHTIDIAEGADHAEAWPDLEDRGFSGWRLQREGRRQGVLLAHTEGERRAAEALAVGVGTRAHAEGEREWWAALYCAGGCDWSRGRKKGKRFT